MQKITTVTLVDASQLVGKRVHVEGIVRLRNWCSNVEDTAIPLNFDTVINDVDIKYTLPTIIDDATQVFPLNIVFYDYDESSFRHADNPYPDRFDASRHYCCTEGDIEPNWVGNPTVWLIDESEAAHAEPA
jgi:hypothetical protein